MDGLGLFGNRETGRRPAASLDRLAKDFNLVQLNATVTAIPDELDASVVGRGARPTGDDTSWQ